LYAHAIPWVLFLMIVGRLVIHGGFGIQSKYAELDPLQAVLAHLKSLACAIAVGIIVGILSGIAFGVIRAVVLAIGFPIAKGIGLGIASGICAGICTGIAATITIGIAEGIADAAAVWVAGTIAGTVSVGIAIGIARGVTQGTGFRIAAAVTVGVAAGIATGIGLGMAHGIALGVLFAIVMLRAYYLPLHLAFVWPTPRGTGYRLHPMAWDNLCSVPYPMLDRLLVSYSEQFPEAGLREIQRLLDECPSQRMAAQRAKTMLIARRCLHASSFTELATIARGLPDGDTGFLMETELVREKTAEITRMQARLDIATKPVIRELLARALKAEVEAFQARVAGLHEPLATEFRRAAQEWLVIAENQWHREHAAAVKIPMSDIFRAGDPVDRNQEAFVQRDSVVKDLADQMLLNTGCPGIILYGRRRMGKSTVLRNIRGSLPDRVWIAVVSLQNPKTFESAESFVRQLKLGIAQACRDCPTVTGCPDSLVGLFDCLSQVDAVLKARSERLLLALDEYEQIDLKIGAGVFHEDLLATLRESVQSHRRITWVLAGSHAITELTHAKWPSYLASLQLIEVPPFTLEETRLLLTDPLRHSALWKPDDPQRPRYGSDFWGDGGIDRIHKEAGGWPHLVQLIAENAVAVVNESDAAQLDPRLIEATLDRAVIRGDNVLSLLMQVESELPGEWDYLLNFRHCDTQPPPDEEILCMSLRRRLLIEDDADQWRLRVPLMRRWLRRPA